MNSTILFKNMSTPKKELNSFNVIDFLSDSSYKSENLDQECVLLYKYRSNKIKLNKKIELTNDLAWLFGFYLAEGTKSPNTLALANNELFLIEKSLSIFEAEFGILLNSWKIVITTSANVSRRRDYWKSIFPSNVLYLYEKAMANKDVLDVRINNRILAEIFRKLFDVCMPLIYENRELSVEFLKGYFVGDGTINVREGCLHCIGATVSKENSSFLEKAFVPFLGLKPNKRKMKKGYELYYSHVESMTFFIIERFFQDLDRQWYKLLSSYLNKQYVGSHLKYWKAIEKKRLSAVQIAKITGNSYESVLDAMKRDVRVGLIFFSKFKNSKAMGPSKKYFYLTESGKRLLKVLNNYIMHRGENEIS